MKELKMTIYEKMAVKAMLAAAALMLAGCSSMPWQKRDAAIAMPVRPASFNQMNAGAPAGGNSGGVTMPPDTALPVRKSKNP